MALSDSAASSKPVVQLTLGAIIDEWSFVSIASVAFGLPIVVEALRQNEKIEALPMGGGTLQPAPASNVPVPITAFMPAAEALSEPLVDVLADPAMSHIDVPPADEAVRTYPMPPIRPVATSSAPDRAADLIAPRGPFQISDLVARIDAFQRQRNEDGRNEPGLAIANDLGDPEPAPEGFSFETDPRGVIRWVSGVSRAALIGVSLDVAPNDTMAQVDGVVAGAFRRRSAFAQARLLIDGQSDAAGQWRISGVPAFDRASGRFTGYRGTARRPRPDERAEPGHDARSPATDSLRQLVHELRTPTTAIAKLRKALDM
jgi:hypothetical protein